MHSTPPLLATCQNDPSIHLDLSHLPKPPLYILHPSNVSVQQRQPGAADILQRRSLATLLTSCRRQVHSKALQTASSGYGDSNQLIVLPPVAQLSSTAGGRWRLPVATLLSISLLLPLQLAPDSPQPHQVVVTVLAAGLEAHSRLLVAEEERPTRDAAKAVAQVPTSTGRCLQRGGGQGCAGWTLRGSASREIPAAAKARSCSNNAPPALHPSSYTAAASAHSGTYTRTPHPSRRTCRRCPRWPWGPAPPGGPALTAAGPG